MKSKVINFSFTEAPLPPDLEWCKQMANSLFPDRETNDSATYTYNYIPPYGDDDNAGYGQLYFSEYLYDSGKNLHIMTNNFVINVLSPDYGCSIFKYYISIYFFPIGEKSKRKYIDYTDVGIQILYEN